MSNTNSAMGPVQARIYATLEADAALMTMIGSRLYDEVPASYGNFPYVQLGEITETPANSMGANGQGRVVEQVIHIYSQAKGWKEAQDILEYLVNDIDTTLLPNPTGWKTYGSWYTFGREIRDPDGTRHVFAKFQIQVGQQ